MAKASKITGEGKTSESGKNFNLSDKAFSLVEKVEESGGNVSAFVSKCIVNYGPLLLGDAGKSFGEKAPLAARLDYLEKAVIALAYEEITEDWDSPTKKAHQAVIRAVAKKTWYSSKTIKEILTAAKDDPKTAGTEPYQWQTLLRHRQEFLGLKE